MADTNVFGEAVFATAADRDACIQALEDFVQATQGTTPYENATYAAGCQSFNNMHVGDSDGPGVKWSYRITADQLTGWSNASGAAVASALDMNSYDASIP